MISERKEGEIMLLLRLYVVAVTALISTQAMAGHLTVLFEEDAPKDRFIIRNDSNCPMMDLSLRIDLGGSAAGLYFDTTAKGAGVNVYQPFEVVQGRDQLADLPVIQDGDKIMELTFPRLSPRSAVVVTIDVDDSLAAGPTGPTMIAGSEIKSARIIANFKQSEYAEGLFADNGYALIMLPACQAV